MGKGVLFVYLTGRPMVVPAEKTIVQHTVRVVIKLNSEFRIPKDPPSVDHSASVSSSVSPLMCHWPFSRASTAR